MNALKTLLLLTLLTLLANCSCSKNSTEPPPATLQLTVEPGVIETWLTVKAENAQPGQEVTLLRNGVERLRLALSLPKGEATAETTVVDTGLLPAHSYTYTAELWNNGKRLAQSDPATATTMDTTSHNFTWEMFEFGGQHGSSVLYDVAIIDENDIWAVGEIHTAETDTFDSLGNWVNPYNAVHWDGSEWELRRILYDNSFWSIKTVYAFSSNEIWFSAFVRWDGTNFIELPIPDILIGYGINKIWGTSSNDLYVAGTQGLIVHYDGQRWRRIEGGTGLPIQDIWGAWNSEAGEWEIMTVASNKYLNEGKRILHIRGNRIVRVADTGLSWSLSGVWFVPGERYYLVGAGIYPKGIDQWNAPWHNYPPGEVTSYFTNRIRGNELNDVVAAGAFGEVVHFNGITWQNFYPETQLNTGSYFGLGIKENLVVAVGDITPRAVILVGRRPTQYVERR